MRNNKDKKIKLVKKYNNKDKTKDIGLNIRNIQLKYKYKILINKI